MAFRNLGDMVDAQEAGRYLYRSYRKQPTQTTASGVWFDLSMSPGNPVPNYYIGAAGVFTSLKRSTDGGIDHGPNVNALGYKKYLRKLLTQTSVATAAPLTLLLLDYIGFYGFIDESVAGEEQLLDNTVAPTRHTTAKNVQMMAVVVAAQAGGQSFQVRYTNQDGVPDRVSQTCTMTTQVVNGTILTSLPAGSGYAGPFIPLQIGDTGVQSVQGVTINGVGDVGLFSLVLVKPIATMDLRGIGAPTEIDYFTDCGGSMPEIADDAYLNFVGLPVGTLANAPIIGIIETTWG